LTQDELVRLRNYVNVNFAGWTLERARKSSSGAWKKSARCTTRFFST